MIAEFYRAFFRLSATRNAPPITNQNIMRNILKSRNASSTATPKKITKTTNPDPIFIFLITRFIKCASEFKVQLVCGRINDPGHVIHPAA